MEGALFVDAIADDIKRNTETIDRCSIIMVAKPKIQRRIAMNKIKPLIVLCFKNFGVKNSDEDILGG